MTMAQHRICRAIPVTFAFLLMSFAGCAARHPATGAKANMALVGVWNWHSQKKGIELTAVIYPLEGQSYLVQAVPFFTTRPLIGCGLFKAKLRRVDGDRYLFCRWMLPNIIDQPTNIAALRKGLTSATESQRVLVQAMIDSARKTGLAQVYFALRLDSISTSRIVITPMLGKNALGSLVTAEGVASSRKALAAFIRSPAGRQLATSQSQVFRRTTVKSSLPVAFYTSP